jgi:endonuclease YncB( thermonuclease family)
VRAFSLVLALVLVLGVSRPMAVEPGPAAVAWFPPAEGECRPPPRRPRRLPPPHVVDPSVIRVVDGDTFHVGALAYRLRGIDTPEWGQPRAWQAARRLAALLGSGPVLIVPRAEDAYGRIVAQVCAGGRDVAAILRREGFQK